jgi:glycosyltransferase involved in cell wall biosynthesis
MIIGVDYTAAAWQGAGIGRYTRELIRSAVALGGPFRYVLFYAARGLPSSSPYLADLRNLCQSFAHVRAVPIALPPRLLTIFWQRLRLPLYVELFTGRLDVLHAPDYALPPTFAHTLLTVHDLTFLVRPDCFEPASQRYLARTVPHSLRRASLVLVDSQASRHDLLRLYPVSPERVTVIYPGVDQRFCPLPASASEPVRQRLGLPQQFLLFVGTLEPRKNLVRLLEALQRVPDVPDLVIAGRKGWLYEEIFATVDRLAMQDRVYFLDFVDDADLPALYNLASAFVYPSLYEGFGLPVAEALACGVPVVTSAVASLPEVAGDAAVLVDPLDIASIAEGIRQALAQAERLRQAGPLQSRRFGWHPSARALLDCYQMVGADAYKKSGG